MWICETLVERSWILVLRVFFIYCTLQSFGQVWQTTLSEYFLKTFSKRFFFVEKNVDEKREKRREEKSTSCQYLMLSSKQRQSFLVHSHRFYFERTWQERTSTRVDSSFVFTPYVHVKACTYVSVLLFCCRAILESVWHTLIYTLLLLLLFFLFFFPHFCAEIFTKWSRLLDDEGCRRWNPFFFFVWESSS